MLLHLLTNIILLAMAQLQLQIPPLPNEQREQQQIIQQAKSEDKQKHYQQPATINTIQQVPKNPPFYSNYFQSKLVLNNNQVMVTNLTEQKLTEMNYYIEKGMIKLPQSSKCIGDILNKASREDFKMNEFLQHKGELENQLKRMEDVIRNSQHGQSPKGKGPQSASFISPDQHKKIIERISKIKKQIDERRKLHLQYEQNRSKQLQKKQQEELRKKHEQQLEQKHKQLKERIEKIMQRRQKMKQEQIQSSKRFKSVREQKRRHQIMEQEFHSSIILPMIQEHSRILQQRTKKQNSIKIEDIKQYEKQYSKSKQQRQKASRSKESSNWHYKAPPYSSSMMKLMELQKRQEQIKEEEEKKRLEALRKRQQTYKEYLNQRFSSVKIDQKKREEIQIRINKQKIAKGLSQEETRELGNKYLGEIKSKLKYIQRDKKSLSTIEEGLKPKGRQNLKIKSATAMSNYQSEPSSSSISDITIHKIDKIVSSSSNKYQKVDKLKIEVDKLSEKTSRKRQLRKYIKKSKQEDRQDIENLLSSIQAKVNIIELYKQ